MLSIKNEKLLDLDKWMNRKKKWMNFQHANENYGHLCCFKAKSREKNCYWEKIAVKGINFREKKTE